MGIRIIHQADAAARFVGTQSPAVDYCRKRELFCPDQRKVNVEFRSLFPYRKNLSVAVLTGHRDPLRALSRRLIHQMTRAIPLQKFHAVQSISQFHRGSVGVNNPFPAEIRLINQLHCPDLRGK